MEKPLLELKGKTLGLIGYGHIAQKVAKIGHAFSMKVIFPELSNQVQQIGLFQKIGIVSQLSQEQCPQDIYSLNTFLDGDQACIEPLEHQ